MKPMTAPLGVERYLNNEDVAKILDCSKQTVLRMTQRGILPEPNRFSKKMVRWRESDINRFLLERHSYGNTSVSQKRKKKKL